MKRHRISINLSAKAMLKELQEELKKEGFYSMQDINEICIKKAYQELKSGDWYPGTLNETDRKLEEILDLLNEFLIYYQ